jgi:hypothetical protein
VGIGTSSPSRLVEIVAGSPALYLVSSNTTGNASVQFGDTDDDNRGRIIYNNTDDSMAFSTSALERMRITSAGNVGIGSTATNAKLEVVSTSGEVFRADVAGGAFRIVANQTQVWLGGDVRFPGVGTTASAANAFLNSASSPANQLLRSTSSIRYKTDVETVETPFADKVLELRPVWYRSKAEADKKEWSWYGLIAEEVAEVEPRLVHWSYPESAYEEVTIESDTEGEESKTERKLKKDAELVPDGVQYERLSVLLLDVVKRQQEAINSLKARVEALEGAQA